MNRIACILIWYLTICSSYGQTKFLEITEGGISSRNYIGKQVQNYSQSNIRLLDTTYRSIELDVKDLTTLDYESIIEDLNACPNIIHLKINYFGGFNKVDYSKVKPFPFDSLKHIEYLQLYAWNVNLQDSTIVDRLMDMPSLNYLHMHRGNGFDYQRPKIKELWNKLKGLALVGLYDPIDISGANFQELNISGKDSLMNLIVSDLSSCPQIHSLDIDFDSLTTGSAHTIAKMKNLKRLSLRHKKGGKQLNVILSELKKLEYLKIFNATGNALQNIASNLKEVEISCQVEKHNQVLEALANLDSLFILDIKINKKDSTINTDLSKFKNLISLNISGGGLMTIDESIGQMKSLKRLNIKYQKLNALPQSFSNLTKLEYLNLSSNQIELIPDLSKMTQLSVVLLRGNKLKSLPQGIENLKKLKELEVSSNRLEGLPDDIGNLRSLENLSAYNNYIEILPRSLTDLKNLKVLNLGTNCLQELPRNLGDLESLKELRLSYNKSLKRNNVKRIKNCQNGINAIPISIKNCKNLTILDLKSAGDFDDEDVKSILQIPNSELKVSMGLCEIGSLPSAGWLDSQIYSIDLSKNRVQSIPLGLLKSKIPEINLVGNDLGIYNQKYDSENLKALILYDRGDIPKELVLGRQGMKETIVKICSRKYYGNDVNPILSFLPLAITIDSIYVENNINTGNYADALLNTGRYDDAIKYYTLTIERQLNSEIRFANEIAVNLDNRHKAYLEVGDTLSAISDLQLIESEFNYNMTPHIFSLYVESGNFDRSKELADSTILFYQELLAKDQIKDQGIILSIMEVYLVTDDYPSFDKAKREYYNIPWTDTYLKIYKYLILVRKLSADFSTVSEVEKFLLELESSSFKNDIWGCSLLASWSKQLGAQKKEVIARLNSAICPN